MRVLYAAACRQCNPDDPLFYDTPEERDEESQAHANASGHTIDVGFTIQDGPAMGLV